MDFIGKNQNSATQTNEEQFGPFQQVCQLLQWLSPEERVKVSKIIDDMKHDVISRKRIEEIDYATEKEQFLAQQRNERTRRSYKNALLRWEKFLVRKSAKMRRGTVNFWELDKYEINEYVDYPRRPTYAFSTVRQDLSVHFSFYSYLAKKYFLQPLLAHSKTSAFTYLRNTQKDERPKRMSVRIPSIGELEKICQEIKQESLLFAIKVAYLHGLLPKDFERIRIDGEFMEIENDFGYKQLGKLDPEMQQLAEHWENEILDIKTSSIYYNNGYHAMLKWNTKISDNVRKLTKKMKSQLKLKHAYTLSDIKRYYTYSTDRAETLDTTASLSDTSLCDYESNQEITETALVNDDDLVWE